jgi:uncharacterized membrane protein YczE
MRLGFNLTSALRISRLMVGLFVYGWGIAMMVHARIGIAPWDVFAQGISIQTKLSFGVSSVIVSIIVLLAWIPLKQKPGIGTVANAILIGLFADLVGPWLPVLNVWWQQLAMFVVGMIVVAFATGLYISSALGAGPRDGLMVGTQRKLSWPFWAVRTMYEATVMTIGWLMGGQVREGTLIFAVCIGYLMQTSLHLFGIQGKRKPRYPLAETGE